MSSDRDTTLYNMLWEEDSDVKEVEEYLEQNSACVNKADSYGEMLMTYLQSKKNCRLDVIKLLLKYGANINFKDPGTYCTPLIAALQKFRCAAVIKLLLENGADVLYNCTNYLEPFPLCIAMHCGFNVVIKLLLNAGCSINGCPKHRTAFHCAVAACWSVDPRVRVKPSRQEIIDLLIEKGADPNAIGPFGRTVICHALGMSCQASFIKMLLKVGTSLNGCNHHPSPFHCAILKLIPLSADVAKLLLDNLVSMLHDVDIDGLTPLQCLLRFKNFKIDTIELFLHHLTDVDIVDENNNNLLHLVIMNIDTHYGKSDVAELLIQRGVRVNMANSDGDQPLHLAIHHNCSPEFIKILLKNGAPVNVKNRSGETPLQIAIKGFGPSLKIIKILSAAISRVGTRNSLIFHWLLNTNADCNGRKDRKYKERCFKHLIRYTLLEIPLPRIPFYGIPNFEHIISYAKYAQDCVEELTKMDSVFVGRGHTLRVFLLKYSSYQKYSICERSVKNYDWNQLLRIKAGSAFPLFRDIIWEKVDRPFMEAKLHELQVYTYADEDSDSDEDSDADKDSDADEDSGGEKILLNYNVVCKIAKKLRDDCLFSLITAYSNNTDDQASSILAGISEKSGEKRNTEESTECGKRVKLMATKSALP